MIVTLDGLQPKVSDATIAFLTETNIDKEVAVFVSGFEVWGRLRGGPLIDAAREQCWRIPAAKRAGTLRLEIEGGTERNDTLDLSWR